MGIYVITGGSSGIGAAARSLLLERGHEVINIDNSHGDIIANLADPAARSAAIEAVHTRCPEGIDGLLLNAGVGPTFQAAKLWAINFFAPIVLAEGLFPLLQKKGGSCCITSSNTISNDLVIRPDWVDLLCNTLDEKRITEFAETLPAQMSPLAYSSGKRALVRWMRNVSATWGASGVRINSVAPGNTRTRMTENMTDQQKAAALLIPIPTLYKEQRFIEPNEIAETMLFLLSPTASAVNGVVLYADGGTDAILNFDFY